MSIKLNDSIRVQGGKPVEDKRLNNGVVYNSVIQANTLIAKTDRYPTLEVAIKIGGATFIYWYKEGIEDSDLVLKQDDISNLEKTSYLNISLPAVAQESWKGMIIYFSGNGNLTIGDNLSDGWTINGITEIGCSLSVLISGQNTWAFSNPSTIYEKQIFTITKKINKIYILGF